MTDALETWFLGVETARVAKRDSNPVSALCVFANETCGGTKASLLKIHDEFKCQTKRLFMAPRVLKFFTMAFFKQRTRAPFLQHTNVSPQGIQKVWRDHAATCAIGFKAKMRKTIRRTVEGKTNSTFNVSLEVTFHRILRPAKPLSISFKV